jgi:hypothetical protein
MEVGLLTKLKAMIWDIPENMRSEISDKILADPFHVFLLIFMSYGQKKYKHSY